MTKKINIYRMGQYSADVDQIKVKRDWMDNTWEGHAYKCFPVTLTNSLGIGISFPEDIEFIWDGVSDTRGEHVKVLQGEKYVFTGRANATISFNTGLVFKTDENTSILHMPVPNQFIDGTQAFTTIISTSFFNNPIPVAWKITKANVPILIPAGTPVIALVPISISDITDCDIDLYEDSSEYFTQEYFDNNKKYGDKAQEINQRGEWSNFYRDAVNYNGESIGKHETKSIRMSINRIEKYHGN